MGTFLIVEDISSHRENIEQHLEQNGHKPFPISGKTTDVLFERASSFLKDEFSPTERLDFLILDVRYEDDTLGGLDLYNRMVLEGLRDYWKHTFVCSQFVDQLESDDGLVLQGFCSAAFIPIKNLISKTTRRGAAILARVNEIQDANERRLVVSVDAKID